MIKTLLKLVPALLLHIAWCALFTLLCDMILHYF
jgi:hypothetical protein